MNWVKNNQVVFENKPLPEKTVQFTAHQEKDINEFAGWYGTYGMVCQFEIKHNHLKTQIQGNSFYLAPHGIDAYVPAKRVLGFMAKLKSRYFLMEEIDGEKLFIESMPWGSLSIIGQQFTPKPLIGNWGKAIGTYYATDSSTNSPQMISKVELTNRNGLTMLKYTLHEALYAQPVETALHPIENNMAYIVGLGRNCGEQIILAQDSISHEYMISFAGLRFKKNK